MYKTESTSASFSLPPVLNALQLAELIHKTPQSILADRCRAPHRLPPACMPAGTKSPLWLLSDVLNWLSESREPAVEPPAVAPAPVKRGRPTKVEQQARRAAAAIGAKGGAA